MIPDNRHQDYEQAILDTIDEIGHTLTPPDTADVKAAKHAHEQHPDLPFDHLLKAFQESVDLGNIVESESGGYEVEKGYLMGDG